MKVVFLVALCCVLGVEIISATDAFDDALTAFTPDEIRRTSSSELDERGHDHHAHSEPWSQRGLQKGSEQTQSEHHHLLHQCHYHFVTPTRLAALAPDGCEAISFTSVKTISEDDLPASLIFKAEFQCDDTIENCDFSGEVDAPNHIKQIKIVCDGSHGTYEKSDVEI